MIETQAASAYSCPLLIKHLWHTPLNNNPHQEIVSDQCKRCDYLTLYQRVGKLASGLDSIGVKPGDVVAVMDWDNHRYLECFFAIPMMGAVLHTIVVMSPVNSCCVHPGLPSDIPVIQRAQRHFGRVGICIPVMLVISTRAAHCTSPIVSRT